MEKKIKRATNIVATSCNTMMIGSKNTLATTAGSTIIFLVKYATFSLLVLF